MTAEEYGAFLNMLLEAERAGAKLLSAYLDELPADFAGREAVRAVQRDEARNCAVLLELLRASGTAPSSATGNFYEKGLAVQGWPERFEFLNRGQAWVAKRLAKALPEVPDSARAALQEMHDSHLDNIRKCETLL
jgi:hypothetical protein